MNIIRVFYSCLILLLTTPVIAYEIIHPKKLVQVDHYMLALMKIALAYSPRTYTFVEYHEYTSRSRQQVMLASGLMSVMWTGYAEQYADIMQPIHVPAYKGLMGHRLFIIRKGDQARFDMVRSFEDLLKIKMGQGQQWPDTEILRHSGFKVTTSVKYLWLFKMLDSSRFDAFPRGAHEPWGELAQHSNLNLTVEKSLVLKYIMPYYFYVKLGESAFASDLKQGLVKAIADGSFDKHFYNDPDVKMALENGDLKKRTIYTIPNPKIGPEVPVDIKEYWLDFSK